jgi:hypothetical protein
MEEEEKKKEYITDPENQWVPEEEKKEEIPLTLGIDINEKIKTGDKMI